LFILKQNDYSVTFLPVARSKIRPAVAAMVKNSQNVQKNKE
jgi:hypothetical protein